MNFKFGLIAFILGFALITSCTKENIDDTTVDEDEVITEVDSCSINLQIIEYGGGILTVNANGGTAPYIYQWSNEETADSIAVEPGIYGVTVTDSEGCIATDSITVGNDPCLSLNAFIYRDTLGTTLTANASGGTPPYLYQWSTEEVSQSINIFDDGTYEVTITDSQGCTFTTSITVGGSDPCDSFDAYISIDGGMFARANGGTPPYSYIWSTGDTTNLIFPNSNGTYEVTVTDSQGCTITLSATYDGMGSCDSLSAFIYTDSLENVLIADAIGGTAPYIYQWSTGEISQNITISSAGTYQVTVTDSQGCTYSTSITVGGSNSCNSFDAYTYVDGGVGVHVSGGTPPYAYIWSTGDTTDFIMPNNSGTYEVTVTDSQGCTITTLVVFDGASSCDSLSVSFELDASGTTLTASGNGGTPPYGYLWYYPDGDTTNMASISVMSGLTYGIYMYDSQGCALEEIYTVP